MTTVETKAPTEVQKFPLTTLIAMVVGSMVGAGIFFLPRNFALAAGVYGALIAWAIAGVGMLMLAFVFQTLAVRKPDQDAGVYAYVKAAPGTVLFVMSRREQNRRAFPGRAGHLRDRCSRGHRRDRRPGDRRDHYLGRAE